LSDRRYKWRIDMAKVIIAFRDYVKAPDNHFSQRGHHIDLILLFLFKKEIKLVQKLNSSCGSQRGFWITV